MVRAGRCRGATGHSPWWGPPLALARSPGKNAVEGVCVGRPIGLSAPGIGKAEVAAAQSAFRATLVASSFAR